ncbi:MAG TPA: radical SAM protein [Candidatus Deferrimicrobiaceae bacterium]|jgi:hypothetical protein
MSRLLLIYPPAVKPCEPPLGLACLLGELAARGIEASAIDANLEACLHLLAEDGSTEVPRRNGFRALAYLRSPGAAESFPRYVTAVRRLDRALSVLRGATGEERVTLGDYVHGGYSPFSPAALEAVSAGAVPTLFSGYYRDSLLPRVVELSPRTIGLSVNFRHQVLPAFELAGMLKRALPGVRIVGGGGMFSSWGRTLRESSLRLPAFDAIVTGAGEATLARLTAGDGWDEGPVMEGGDAVRFAPDFGFARLGEYLSPVPVLPVTASRGCYWRRCAFCPEAATPTHGYACIEAARFPALLLSLSERYGVRHFHLTDNAIPVNVLRAIAGRADDLSRLRWHGFVRFERALADPALAAALARSGCRMLQLGLESGSQRVLDRLKKGTHLEDASAILANLSRAGIATYVYVMLGMPGETEADAEATRAFLEAHAGAIGFLNVALMNLPRDSAFLDAPEEHGIRDARLYSEDEPLGLYRSFASANGWSRAEARRFLSKRMLGTPAIRAIVNRTPPLFTSNHAFLFAPGSGGDYSPGGATGR